MARAISFLMGIFSLVSFTTYAACEDGTPVQKKACRQAHLAIFDADNTTPKMVGDFVKSCIFWPYKQNESDLAQSAQELKRNPALLQQCTEELVNFMPWQVLRLATEDHSLVALKVESNSCKLLEHQETEGKQLATLFPSGNIELKKYELILSTGFKLIATLNTMRQDNTSRPTCSFTSELIVKNPTKQEAIFSCYKSPMYELDDAWQQLAFCARSKRLFAADSKGKVDVYNLLTGAYLALIENSSPVSSMCIDSSGNLMCSLIGDQVYQQEKQKVIVWTDGKKYFKDHGCEDVNEITFTELVKLARRAKNERDNAPRPDSGTVQALKEVATGVVLTAGLVTSIQAGGAMLAACSIQ